MPAAQKLRTVLRTQHYHHPCDGRICRLLPFQVSAMMPLVTFTTDYSKLQAVIEGCCSKGTNSGGKGHDTWKLWHVSFLNRNVLPSVWSKDR